VLFSEEGQQTYSRVVDGLIAKLQNEATAGNSRSSEALHALTLAKEKGGYGYDLADAGDRVHAAEEYLARWAEEADKPGTVTRIVAAIRKMLQSGSAGFVPTDADVWELLQRARERAETAHRLADLSSGEGEEGSIDASGKQREISAKVGDSWLKIAGEPSTASLGETPAQGDFQTILRTLGGMVGGKIEVSKSYRDDGSLHEYVFKDTQGGRIELNVGNPRKPYINSAHSRADGTLIYQTIYAWAHIHGWKIHPDPYGLTGQGILRRTSQMLSSALRFRSTEHMLPAPHQKLDGWRRGSSLEAARHNIGLLAQRERQLVFKRLEKLPGFRYRDGDFHLGAEKIPANAREQVLTDAIKRLDPKFSHAVGESTLARALVTQAIHNAVERGRPLRSLKGSALEQIRYSARPATQESASE